MRNTISLPWKTARWIVTACICVASSLSLANDLGIKKYSYRLFISGSYNYDSQAGQDAGTERFLSILPDEKSSELLRQRFGEKFTGLVIVANDQWLLSSMGVPKRCQNISRSGDQIAVTLASFSHPLPFDPDTNWLTATAVEVRSNKNANAAQVQCEKR